MAKARLIWSSIAASDRVNDLGWKGALLFTWMLAFADDQGRMAGGDRRIKALVVPLRDEITVKDCGEALTVMQDAGLVILYTDPSTNRRLVQLADWWEYNPNLRFAEASKHPPPDGWIDRVTKRDELGRFKRSHERSD